MPRIASVLQSEKISTKAHSWRYWSRIPAATPERNKELRSQEDASVSFSVRIRGSHPLRQCRGNLCAQLHNSPAEWSLVNPDGDSHIHLSGISLPLSSGCLSRQVLPVKLLSPVKFEYFPKIAVD